MNKKLIALAALLPCLALVGCCRRGSRAESVVRDRRAGHADVDTGERTHMPAASGIVSSVWVDVYPGATFKSKHGCRCTLPEFDPGALPGRHTGAVSSRSP